MQLSDLADVVHICPGDVAVKNVVVLRATITGIPSYNIQLHGNDDKQPNLNLISWQLDLMWLVDSTELAKQVYV